MSNGHGPEEWQQREMTEYESGVLTRLLGGAFPGVETLRKQLGGIQVQQVDVDGSIQFRGVGGPAAEIRHRVPVEGQYLDQDGDYLRALLHIVDGYLHELEFCKDSLNPVQRQPRIEDWEVMWLD